MTFQNTTYSDNHDVGPEAIQKLMKGEMVLLVEDDGSILKLGRTILENPGYTVLTAITAAEAVDLAV